MKPWWNWKNSLLGRVDLAYRQEFLREDIILTRSIFAIVACSVLVFIYPDYLELYPSLRFSELAFLRIALFCASAILFFSFKKAQNVNKIDHIILLWSMSYLILTLFSTLSRNALSIENININHLWVLAFYMLLPNRPLFKVIPALFVSAISIYILLNAYKFANQGFTTINVFSNITNVIAFNMIGFFACMRLDAQRYYQHLTQKTLRTGRDQLVTLAKTDSLTGILNRRGFFELAEVEVDRYQRYQTTVSFTIIDLDNLKGINDNFGHPAGDLALQVLIDCVEQNRRSSDFFGRLAGDEFGLCLPGIHKNEAEKLVSRIKEKLSAVTIPVLNEPPLRIYFSAGITEIRTEDEHFDDLYHRADKALYSAKQMGRNRVEII